MTSNAPPKSDRKVKTRAELAELRKQMMRRPSSTVKGNVAEPIKPKSTQEVDTHLNQDQVFAISTSTAGHSSMMHTMQGEPNPALMDRLASGKATKVNKKDMKNLAKKNYMNLPEQKRKKEEERKKLLAAENKEKIRQYQKQLQAMSRANLKKKRPGTSVNLQPKDDSAKAAKEAPMRNLSTKNFWRSSEAWNIQLFEESTIEKR